MYHPTGGIIIPKGVFLPGVGQGGHRNSLLGIPPGVVQGVSNSSWGRTGGAPNLPGRGGGVEKILTKGVLPLLALKSDEGVWGYKGRPAIPSFGDRELRSALSARLLCRLGFGVTGVTVNRFGSTVL